MKNIFRTLGIIALIAAIGFGAAACGDPDNNNTEENNDDNNNNDPTSATYISYDAYGNCYTLVVTKDPSRAVYAPQGGDSYVLTITDANGTEIGKSTGTVTAVNNSTLTLSKDGSTFTITVSESGISDITGNIPLDAGGTRTPPAALTTTKPTAADRWRKWVSSSSTATLDISVDDDEVCTITVGETAESSYEYGYRTQAQYTYTAKTHAAYEYEFEAWTESGERIFTFQYYYDDDTQTSIDILNRSITNVRTTYTIKGNKIPKGGDRYLAFHCADQLGTFYVKILSITEYEYTPELEYELINDQGSSNNGTYRVISGAAMSGAVEIPAIYNQKAVTEIGDFAFDHCTSLTSITIPASITSIGKTAFHKCTSLTDITFAADSRLETIGKDAFRSCISLIDITIPASVITIGHGAFASYSDDEETPMSLRTVTFAADSQLESIDHFAFQFCESLTSITIPEGVMSIGAGAFEGCTSLENIIIPEGVTEIGSDDTGWSGTFRDCTSITSITIPASVISVGTCAFSGWTASQIINVPFASEQEANDTWGEGWQWDNNYAVIKYWNGSIYE